MNPDTYYRDHWAEIDEDRLDNYEAMFEWHPRMEPLLRGAELTAGQRVLDYGCGPGGLAMEIARRAGSGGEVHGLDLNGDMIERANARSAREGMERVCHFKQHTEDSLPFDDGFFDRVVCKSVLEYVSDPGATIAEFARVTGVGGRVHVVDSDWGMLVAEPLNARDLDELFTAANMAYHTPHIGRKLYGLFKAAGLSDIQVRILCSADTTGIRRSVMHHMVGYARESGRMDGDKLDAIEKIIDGAIEAGNYMMVLPQFVVSAKVA